MDMEFRTRSTSAVADLGHSRFDSLDAVLAKPLRDGLTSLKTNNRWFDVLYEDRGADVTFVTFAAALPSSAKTYPRFSSQRTAGLLNANLLAFADAGSGSRESLPTFWHLSTKRVDAQRYVPEIIRHAITSRSGTHLIFFGSSAGGFAALNYSAQFPDSVALVMNPRTNLLSTPIRFPGYAETTYPGANVDRLARRMPTSMPALYSKSRGNTVAYLQNTQDKNYYSHHFLPFVEATSGQANVFVRAKPWGVGHVVPPRDEFLEPLQRLVSNAPNWGSALENSFVGNAGPGLFSATAT